MSLRDLLFKPETLAEAGAVAVHAGASDCTWAELAERANDVACALADVGVRPGQAVGVMLPNGIDLVATLFGVWRADAVYVPLNPRLTDPEIDRIVGTLSPAAIVTTADHATRLHGRPVVVREPGGVWRNLGDTAPASPAAELGEGVALVQFTSGTTGAPKPVLLEHDGVLRLLDGVVGKIRGSSPRADDKPARPPMPNLIPVSLSLWAGLYNVLFAFRVGAPVVVMDGFDPVEFADLVVEHGIRSTVLPPAAMTMLAGDVRVTDLAPLRIVRSITAPLAPVQARRFKDRFGITVLNSYGQTELGGEIVGWNAADGRAHGDAKLGSVGRPHEGVELRIIEPGDSNGQVTELATDEVGELWVRTPAMAAGYADGSDLGDRLSADGWFRTGDIARVDGDGFLWIEGRVADMVNRGGLKIHPGEVEDVLLQAPGVADVAVVGVADERLGEVPWAFVVPTDDDQPPDPDELAALCRQHLAPYKVPVGFETIGALPRNEVGKVLKRALADTVVTR
jgi:acyl-CoA synthetase (AMP-forming)/AMP-acid ligase II